MLVLEVYDEKSALRGLMVNIWPDRRQQSDRPTPSICVLYIYASGLYIDLAYE